MNKDIKFYQVGTFIAAFCLAGVLFSSCGYQSFFTRQLAFPTIATSATPRPSSSSSVEASIRSIKPALAVRGVSCLVCHSQINANVITDFGYGDSWFMDSGSWESEGWYSNYFDTWQSASINGQVFIPSANVNTQVYLAAGTPLPGTMKLLDLFQTPYTFTQYWMQNNFPTYNSASNGQIIPMTYAAGFPAMSARVNSAMTVGIIPPSDQAAVVEKSQILIQAPQTSDIQGLVPAFAASPGTVAFQEIRSAEVTLPHTNFILAGSGQNQYITHPTGDGDLLICYGDVVINGPLFLNNVTIATDANGCRLYVAGTVFIQGVVNYFTANNNSNLQISSSRAILMGLGTTLVSNYTTDPTTLRNGTVIASSIIDRLDWINGDIRNPLVRPGSDYSNAQGLYALAFADANIVNGITLAQQVSQNVVAGNLVDAADPAYTVFVNNVLTNPTNYTAMFLNAPLVESRYLGLFKGTIVSELALFRLGQFNFQYDPVFENISILPLLTGDILIAQ